MMVAVTYIAGIVPQSGGGSLDVCRGVANVCMVVALTVFLWQLVSYVWYRSPANHKNKGLRLLASGMVLTWAVGYGAYMEALARIAGAGRATTDFELLLRPAIGALGMFTFNLDSNIFDGISGHPLLRGVLSACAFVAGMLMLWLLAALFGSRLLAAARTMWRSLLPFGGNLYVFFDVNEQAWLLARDIRKNEPNSRIVFVEFPPGSDDDLSSGWKSFLRSFAHKQGIFRQAREAKAFLAFASAPLSVIPATGMPHSSLRRLRLASVARMVKRCGGRGVHLFFLSDEEEVNISSVSVLQHDKAVMAAAECRRPTGGDERMGVWLYCRARYNSVSRCLEDEQPQAGMAVRLVDTARLSVETLKQQVELQPVMCVDVGADATVSSAFHALVVGFGDVGRNAVRYLYEYGAFVKTGSTDRQVRRSDFHCHVADRQMDRLAGPFIDDIPHVRASLFLKPDDFPQQPDAAATPSPDTLLSLCKLDSGSAEFSRMLNRLVPTLNYVVVATGSDEANMSLAVHILQLAIRLGTPLAKLRIMVLVRRDTSRRFQHIAEHYNRLSTADGSRPLNLFGMDAKLFSYQYLVSDSLWTDAMAFKRRYEATHPEERQHPSEAPRQETASSGYAAVMRHRRIQYQDMANSLHKGTKLELVRRALTSEELNLLTGQCVLRKAGATTYVWRDAALRKPSVERVLEVLAQTEHLRWNASHEMHGYQPMPGHASGKDEARQLHGCLCPWEDIPNDMRVHDYNVVDVSLGLPGPVS